MAARPCMIDPRGVEDFWRDVDARLSVEKRSRRWLCDRIGLDAAAASRMANGQTHTPVDVALTIAAELSPTVLSSLTERAGLQVTRGKLERWSSRTEDAQAAFTAMAETISSMAADLANGDMDADELDERAAELQVLRDRIDQLLAHRGQVGPRAVGG